MACIAMRPSSGNRMMRGSCSSPNLLGEQTAGSRSPAGSTSALGGGGRSVMFSGLPGPNPARLDPARQSGSHWQPSPPGGAGACRPGSGTGSRSTTAGSGARSPFGPRSPAGQQGVGSNKLGGYLGTDSDQSGSFSAARSGVGAGRLPQQQQNSRGAATPKSNATAGADYWKAVAWPDQFGSEVPVTPDELKELEAVKQK
eukprot:gnl/TRDRNA2_/TRDRNA2_179184_c0_seq1.p1 gnl/TRDRNA2_/TRDRNA2_179184_c0~~gnl/TRDRNA2_/TRDRNA2_179184_c0_seq1.p1  ORF type:complete len:200 (+),score=30.04 gnl/TRDRNA2_/TRDRNA2_179184_c0_seq1:95-694(+)